MLKFYRVGQTIHSLDGTSQTFESINQAKAHVRKVIRPGYGELLSNPSVGNVRKERAEAWKAALKAKREADTKAEAEKQLLAKLEADRLAAEAAVALVASAPSATDGAA